MNVLTHSKIFLRGVEVAQVVEYLPRKCKTLSSNTSTAKKPKNLLNVKINKNQKYLKPRKYSLLNGK
jgi:hypothetical protein